VNAFKKKPAPPTSCPDTFHLCPRSAEHAGFSVLDRTTGKETAAADEAEARQIAERDYPGCEFALSTITNARGNATAPGVPDAVIVAVLRRLDDAHCEVVAYVVASVMGEACVPFSANIWTGVKDHLPHDHRRPRRRS
jgi:hypothetical protein